MSGTSGNGFVEVTYISEDGLDLHARDYDPGRIATGTNLPIVCLPGLTRNCRDFHQFATLLSGDKNAPRRVIAIDYRGRGLSDWDSNSANYNLGTETRDVIAACDHLEVGRAIFVGTSRGGLILHLLAEMAPGLAAAVVLNDIGPEITVKGLTRIRDYLGSGDMPQNWREAVIALKLRHLAEFPALRETDWREMADAIYREANGKIVADFDPAIAVQTKAIDFDRPLPDLWRQYSNFADMPLMLIRGENSDLLSEATVKRMAAEHPGLITEIARGQGHAPLLHLEPTFGAIRSFIETI